MGHDKPGGALVMNIKIPSNSQKSLARPADSQQAGFTILEMLIAISVFSMVLLIISAALIQLGRQFYHGVTKARTQQVARNVNDEIVNAIKYSTSDARRLDDPASPGDDPNTEAWCISERRYIFAERKRLGIDTNFVALRDNNCNAAIPRITDPVPAGAVELVDDRMRINFSLERRASMDLWNVAIAVYLGEDDQLCSPTVGNCVTSDVITMDQLEAAKDLVCKFQAGSQFCATAHFETLVDKRL